jgi:hypothetical protein
MSKPSLIADKLNSNPAWKDLKMAPPLGVSSNSFPPPTMSPGKWSVSGTTFPPPVMYPEPGYDIGNSQMINVTSGFPTNEIVSVQKYIRRTIDIPEIDMTGHILIEKGNRVDKEKRFLKYRPNNMYTAFQLQQWNYWRHTKQPKPTDPEKVLTAEEYWKDFNVVGAVKHVEHASNRYSYDKSLGADKSVLLFIRGKVLTHNFWPSDLKPTSRLYFILKKVKSSGMYRLDPNSQAFTSIDLNKFTDRPFVLVPWASAVFDTPSLADRVYQDEYGRTGYGKVIYLGRLDESTFSPQAPRSDIVNLPFDIWTTTNRPKIFMNFDY